MGRFYFFVQFLLILPCLKGAKTGSSCYEPGVNQYSTYAITPSATAEEESEDTGTEARYPEGSIVKYRCDPDMVLEGEQRQHCKRGKWSAKAPLCYFDLASKSKLTSLTPYLVDGNLSSRVSYTSAINKTREMLLDFFYTRHICKIELYSNVNLTDTQIDVVFYHEGGSKFNRERLTGQSDKVPSGYRYTLVPTHGEERCPTARNISLKQVKSGDHLSSSLNKSFLQEIRVLSHKQDVILEQCQVHTTRSFYAIPFTDGRLCYFAVHETALINTARKLCQMFHPEANLSIQTTDEFYRAFTPPLNTGHVNGAKFFIGKRPDYMWDQDRAGNKICPLVRPYDHMVDNTFCSEKRPFLCQAKARSCQLPPLQQIGPHRMVLPDGEHVQFLTQKRQVEEKRCEMGQLK